MTQHLSPIAHMDARRGVTPRVPSGVTLTAADFDVLLQELERLRSAHRTDLAQRLRDARAFGSPGDDDDRLAVYEDVAIDQARIAQLGRLIAGATIVDEALPSEGAGLGSFVWVQDDDGGAARYEIVGRRGPDQDDCQISLASPVGEALLGSRPGDVVRVALPHRRERSLTVLDVRVGGPGRFDRADVAA